MVPKWGPYIYIYNIYLSDIFGPSHWPFIVLLNDILIKFLVCFRFWFLNPKNPMIHRFLVANLFLFWLHPCFCCLKQLRTNIPQHTSTFKNPSKIKQISRVWAEEPSPPSILSTRQRPGDAKAEAQNVGKAPVVPPRLALLEMVAWRLRVADAIEVTPMAKPLGIGHMRLSIHGIPQNRWVYKGKAY